MFQLSTPSTTKLLSNTTIFVTDASIASLVTAFSANILDVCTTHQRVMRPLRTPRLTASVRLDAPSLAYIEET